jgi:hypothetical protein
LQATAAGTGSALLLGRRACLARARIGGRGHRLERGAAPAPAALALLPLAVSTRVGRDFARNPDRS